ncbi:MAG: hypothetical protein ACJ77A_18845 [Actinomycetota bacterium]
MAIRSFSGRLVAVGVVALAVGGTYLLNTLTAGPPKELRDVLAASGRSTPVATVDVTPTSGPAEPGRAYPVEVTIPCGFVGAVDFDGAFWVPTDGRALAVVGRRLSRPVVPATIALQSSDSALLRTAAGQAVALTRSPLGHAGRPVCG